MSDEISHAFELPAARARATAAHQEPDRISVRDYEREVEIGAFQAERGVTQRVRFNVVLEVSHSAASASDDVDQVLSYDSITEAIETELGAERLNLLETLAERIAVRVLENPRAVRIFVRIEKLDRIPGRLGIEIVRRRAAAARPLRSVEAPARPVTAELRPLVVYLDNAIIRSDTLVAWLDAIEAHALPAIICVDTLAGPRPHADHPAAERRMRLLDIEQNAWVLAGKDKRCVVVDSRTELEWDLKHGQLSVWAPSKIVLDAVDGPKGGEIAPLDLARWLAEAFSAEVLAIAGRQGPAARTGERHVAAPTDL